MRYSWTERYLAFYIGFLMSLLIPTDAETKRYLVLLMVALALPFLGISLYDAWRAEKARVKEAEAAYADGLLRAQAAAEQREREFNNVHGLRMQIRETTRRARLLSASRAVLERLQQLKQEHQTSVLLSSAMPEGRLPLSRVEEAAVARFLQKQDYLVTALASGGYEVRWDDVAATLSRYQIPIKSNIIL